jgi:serine/threonine protein kinase
MPPPDSSDESSDFWEESEESASGDDSLLGDEGGLFLRPGERPIQGQDWVLIKKIGSSSGFGEVWLARDEAIHVDGVFKFCRDPNRKGHIASLHNEVDKLRAINHDGIVRLTAANLRAKPPFLQYEYVPHSYDLKQVLQDYKFRYSDQPDIADACHVILAIAETLAFCHSQDPPLVHRDLKPANILVLDYDLLELAKEMNLSTHLSGLRFKLLDFGLAARARSKGDESQHQVSLGRVFDGLGTWGYRSPQQRSGNKGYRPCPSDDVYSLGVMWYELVTGRSPYEDDDFDVFQMRLEKVKLPDVLKSILLRCLAFEASDRITDATQLVQGLGKVLSNSSRGVRESLREEFRDSYQLNLSGLTKLSAEAAQVVTPEGGNGHLFLNGLTVLSAEAAMALAKCRGCLYLNGLTTLSTEVAKALAQHKGISLSLCGLTSLAVEEAKALGHRWVHLDGLTTLSSEAAKALVQHGGNLTLRGLTSLSAEAAEALGQYNGCQLLLDGLTTLSTEAAKALAKYKGELSLSGLRELSSGAAEELVQRKGTLELDGLETLTTVAAQVLGQHDGYLSLNGLRSLSAQAASALALNNGGLSLEGLTTLPATAAKALAQNNYDLNLDGLTRLSIEAAVALGRHQGFSLSLNGLTTLSTAAAKALGQYNGDDLYLNGVTSLSAEAYEALKEVNGLELDGLLKIEPDDPEPEDLD